MLRRSIALPALLLATPVVITCSAAGDEASGRPARGSSGAEQRDSAIGSGGAGGVSGSGGRSGSGAVSGSSTLGSGGRDASTGAGGTAGKSGSAGSGGSSGASGSSGTSGAGAGGTSGSVGSGGSAGRVGSGGSSPGDGAVGPCGDCGALTCLCCNSDNARCKCTRGGCSSDGDCDNLPDIDPTFEECDNKSGGGQACFPRDYCG